MKNFLAGLITVFFCSFVLLLNSGIREKVFAQHFSQPPRLVISFDYDSGWIEPPLGEEVVLEHNLGGDPGEYVWFVTGRDVFGDVHSRTFQDINPGQGLRVYSITNKELTFHRGWAQEQHPPEEQWDQVRIRILRNQ
jgi:hypothetical protein